MQNGNHPLVVEIKRGSHEDGPGIRSVVFFKGCPLRCVFCHSPETQNPKEEIVFSARKCTYCGDCADSCPQGAIDLSRPERINREKCISCGQCAGVCPGDGLRLIGRYYTVEELMEIVLRDLPFYRHSHGGVTLSGGECTMHSNYLESLLKSLKARQIHLVLETCGFFNFKVFKRKILPYIDLIYYDVKFADPETHRKYTGKTNQKILNNLHRLLLEKPAVVHPRIPLIPGITTTRENLSAIVEFLCEAGAHNVTLLPYNPLGIEMVVKLGRSKASLPEAFMKPDKEKEVFAMFQAILEERRDKVRLDGQDEDRKVNLIKKH
ncbi:MAG: glycyl-radical enzyme activating protein [Planctomycetes bacterium]|nr:glycyl-radical enzyme activating protein [Planctomycetota bacterium]